MRHACFASLLVICACSDPAGDAAEIPLIAPPVRAAAPEAFTTSGKAVAHFTGDELQMRFFSGAGPTDVFAILDSIDERIAGFNDREGDCKTAAATAYTIEPFGESVTMQASCVEDVGGGNFVQLKVPDDDDPAAYLYEAFAVGHRAAIITPEGDGYIVDAWLSVGYDNADTCGAFDCGSYAGMRLHANSATGDFELSVAGLGIGFCGAQLRSDTASIYAEGSDDMVATCAAAATACTDAADLGAAGACDDLTAFVLPALGREAGAGFAASTYPSTPNLTLDGTATDGIHFGPSTPTAGVAPL